LTNDLNDLKINYQNIEIELSEKNKKLISLNRDYQNNDKNLKDIRTRFDENIDDFEIQKSNYNKKIHLLESKIELLKKNQDDGGDKNELESYKEKCRLLEIENKKLLLDVSKNKGDSNVVDRKEVIALEKKIEKLETKVEDLEDEVKERKKISKEDNENIDVLQERIANYKKLLKESKEENDLIENKALEKIEKLKNQIILLKKN
jgi:DNA repair exonuclease SbcCD ATPase subunit